MRIRWNWGWAAALAYTVFALSTVGFVIFAIAHPAALVSSDYYRQALAHDRRIAAIANADAAGASIGVTMETGAERAAVLHLPASHHGTSVGTVTWYRADIDADRAVPLAVDREGVQRLTLQGLVPGRWRLKVEWDADGRPFYFERVVTLSR